MAFKGTFKGGVALKLKCEIGGANTSVAVVALNWTFENNTIQPDVRQIAPGAFETLFDALVPPNAVGLTLDFNLGDASASAEVEIAFGDLGTARGKLSGREAWVFSVE